MNARAQEIAGQIGALVGELVDLASPDIVQPAATVPPIAAPAPAPAAPAAIAPAAADGPHPGFADEPAFYDALRAGDLLGPKITSPEFTGCNLITRAAAAAHWPVSFVAYGLATVYLESSHTMQPVKEAFWLNPAAQAAYFRRMYDIQGQRPDKARELGNVNPGDGALFPGEGFVQATGRKNYERGNAALRKYGITDVDLTKTPELMMRPDIAAIVMIDGMSVGWFTTHKLADYLPAAGPASRAQFIPCRTIINGHDREADVANYAVDFQTAVIAGKWRF